MRQEDALWDNDGPNPIYQQAYVPNMLIRDVIVDEEDGEKLISAGTPNSHMSNEDLEEMMALFMKNHKSFQSLHTHMPSESTASP